MAKGKSFKANMEETKNNAALAFITQPQEVEAVGQGQKEFKTEQMRLLLRPSLKENLTILAAMKRTSVNDLVHTIAEEYVEQNARLIEKYKEITAEE